MKRNQTKRNEMERNEMKICSCRKNGGLLVVYSRCVYSDILNRKFPQKSCFAQKSLT